MWPARPSTSPGVGQWLASRPLRGALLGAVGTTLKPYIQALVNSLTFSHEASEGLAKFSYCGLRLLQTLTFVLGKGEGTERTALQRGSVIKIRGLQFTQPLGLVKSSLCDVPGGLVSLRHMQELYI